jgi:F0F1-type ATP synthase membrane subunit c/vacuolar-type H+-ATPase subunit K
MNEASQVVTQIVVNKELAMALAIGLGAFGPGIGIGLIGK